MTVAQYGRDWLDARRDLRPKTHDLYSYLFRFFIEPHLGPLRVDGLDAPIVRRWYGEVAAGPHSQATVAKAYRLLRQLMEAAVNDRLVRANPCTIKGASSERSAERRVPSVAEVWKLADVISPEYRLMVLLAAFAGLRRGECFALRRARFDDSGPTKYLSVTASRVYLAQSILEQPPKTAAGSRRLAVPEVVAVELALHLERYVDVNASALVFADRRTGETPTPIVWRRVWNKAKASAGVDYTFHDLRHVAGTLNASAGASIRESMARMGHASPRAALRYQHVVDQRDAEVAQSIDRLVGRPPTAR